MTIALVTVVPFVSNNDPSFTFTEPEPSAAEWATVSVPAETESVPVKPELSPARRTSPAPDLITLAPDVPESEPENVEDEDVFSVKVREPTATDPRPESAERVWFAPSASVAPSPTETFDEIDELFAVVSVPPETIVCPV
jgi:hypothetical protein